MTGIDNVLAFNREYVAAKGYEKHITDIDSVTGELTEIQGPCTFNTQLP